jgi:hypothetical protein
VFKERRHGGERARQTVGDRFASSKEFADALRIRLHDDDASAAMPRRSASRRRTAASGDVANAARRCAVGLAGPMPAPPPLRMAFDSAESIIPAGLSVELRVLG